jgi:replicative DNA helicase
MSAEPPSIDSRRIARQRGEPRGGFAKMDDGQHGDKIDRVEDVLHEVFEVIESRGQRGIETGFFELDDMLNGMQRGNMILLGSRPGIGKSAFASNLVEHVAVDSMVPCAVFLLEMSKHEYAQRMLTSRATVDGHKLRKGFLQSHEYVNVAEVCGEVAKAPLWVLECPGIYLDDLCDRIEEVVREQGVRLVVIDYVQLVEAQGENRTEQLTLISRRLKALALRLKIVLLCVSQLNRGMFQPNMPRPRAEDLRGSGTLEDEADVILLLHRDDYYRMNDPDFVPDCLADLIIAKQRTGPTGTVRLTFLSRTTRFENLSVTADQF